ncbi:MAG: hypothetical protein HDT29_05975 [Clostridiales bacterium]|nr:hypothetical protein [Clostridiales bacterium]
MDIRKRKLKGYVALSILIIVCMIMASAMTIFVPNKNVESSTLTYGAPSVLNLNAKGGEQDYFSNVIESGQKQSIYLGSDSGQALKWRILSVDDYKYNSKNNDSTATASEKSWLVWADSSITTLAYNKNYYVNNVYSQTYAYWSSSYIRAKLNGGYYLAAVTSENAVAALNQQIKLDDASETDKPYLETWFNTNERGAILQATAYTTSDFAYSDNYNPQFQTTGITTSGNAASKYNTSIVSTMNGHVYAKNNDEKISSNSNSVTETTVGDYLFLIDYYDLNNTAYGMGDSGVTYAQQVVNNASTLSSWTNTTTTQTGSSGYPSYYEGTSYRSTGYIIGNDLFSGAATTYLLRPAGRNRSTSNSYAMVVSSPGYVGFNFVNNAYGVRPAFNFSPTNANIIYATAADLSSNGANFISVTTAADSTPAYKLYMKSSDYVNYNQSSSGRPSISVTNNSVSVTKSGQSGSAIILLADKSGNGAVSYQATATFNNGVATANLNGVNASDYSITVLFTDGAARGGYCAESITGSYTVNGALSVADISVDYNGSAQTLETLKTSLDWYNSVYADSSIVKVEYLVGTQSVTPTNAGNYTIRLTLLKPNEYAWGDTTGDSDTVRTIDFEIKQIVLTYPSISSNSKPYNGGNDVRFQLNNFDPNIMDLNWEDNYYSSGVSINKTTLPYSVSAQSAGTYELVASIKSTHAINYRFASTSELKVIVTPAELVIERLAVSGGTNSNFSIAEGATSTSADIYVDVNGAPLGSDKVPITIFIPYSGTDITVSSAIELDASTLQSNNYKVENQQIINLGSFFEGSYTLDVKTSDSNYTISLKNAATLTVLPAGQRTNILWKLYEGNVEKTFYRTVTELTETGVKTLANSVVYSGEQFAFQVDLPNGYTLDTNYGSNGYLVEKISGDGNVLGKDAGTYKTSIKLGNDIYSIEWTIDKTKFNLTNVKWQYPDGMLPYTVGGISAVLDESKLPEGLIARYTYETIKGTYVGQTGSEEVYFELASGYDINYYKPVQGDADSYEGTFDEWTLDWEVVKAVINANWTTEKRTDDNGVEYTARVLNMSGYPSNIITYRYYEVNSASEITETTPYITKIEIEENKVKTYVAQAVFTSDNGDKYELSGSEYSIAFGVGTYAEELQISINKELTYNGNAQPVEIIFDKGSASADIFEITYYDKNGTTPLASAPTNVGDYRVEIKIKDSVSGYYLAGDNVESDVAIIEYSIAQMQIDSSKWNTSHNPPSLGVTAKEMQGIKHEYADMDDNPLQFSDLKAGNSYKVRAVITDKNNYVFADGTTETEWQEFTVSANEQIYDPDDPNNPFYPGEDGTDPSNPNGNGDNEGGNFNFDKITEALKQWWQVIASAISIILIVAFMAKGLGYASKKKENKRVMDSKYSAYAVGLFGITMTNWTIIACILMGVAVLAFIFMLLEKSGYKKSLRALEDAKDEYAKNQKEAENKQMQMMLMGMMGGNANGQGFAYQQGVSADEMRLMLNDAMSAMLPSVTQYLPQEASSNEDIMRKLEEQNEENEKRIKQLNEENEDRIKQLTESNEKAIEKLVEKLSKQQEVEKQAEREVASTNANDEVIKSLLEGQKAIMEKLSRQDEDKQLVKLVEKDSKDEKIEMLMRNQEMLMRQIMEMSGRNNDKQVVMPYMPQPTLVQQPAEKIIIEKPVEKIVEKEVRVEVPVEKIVEVEKVVPMPIEKPAPKAKAPARRLTLDEAYAKLSDKQKKIFDTLKAYAMSKDKCKEKKSTYFIVLGQSTVNPLVKLTIKKNTTVALFKMEDEYFKDIRRNAGSDGTKVKVKESEVVVNDAQALATAKNMVDLREDQIERYNEYLREQRAMKRK